MKFKIVIDSSKNRLLVLTPEDEQESKILVFLAPAQENLVRAAEVSALYLGYAGYQKIACLTISVLPNEKEKV